MRLKLLGSIVVVVAAITVAFTIRLVRAQAPFAGYKAYQQEYFCDPSTGPSRCPPVSLRTVEVLPTGENVNEVKIPRGMNPDLVTINTYSFRAYAFPTTGKYYMLPIRKVDTFTSGDVNCSHMATLLAGPSTLKSESSVKGFQAFIYDTARPDGLHSTNWLFPAAGCAPLQSVSDFGTSKSYTNLVVLTVGFADRSILNPVGTKDSPANIYHDLYVAFNTSPDRSSPQTVAQAEAQWQADMANPSSQNYARVHQVQDIWLKRGL